MDIKAIKKSDILRDGEKKQQYDLNRGSNEQILNRENAIMNDINKNISQITADINEIKKMFFGLIFVLIFILVLMLIK